MGVVQRASGPRVTFEALLQPGIAGQVRGENLEGYSAVQPGVRGLVDFTLAPRATERGYLVGSESFASGKGHLVIRGLRLPISMTARVGAGYHNPRRPGKGEESWPRLEPPARDRVKVEKNTSAVT